MTSSTSHKELLGSLFKEPGFRRAYYKQRVFNDLLAQVVQRRLEEGLTQHDLAEKLRTYQSAISRIEAGNQNVTLATIVEIADALNSYVDMRLIPYLDFSALEIPVTASSFSTETATVKTSTERVPVW